MNSFKINLKKTNKIYYIRRYKPNSRALLIGEQPNPSKLLLLEERTSRHRGVKHPRQYVLSPDINLFNYVKFKGI